MDYYWNINSRHTLRTWEQIVIEWRSFCGRKIPRDECYERIGWNEKDLFRLEKDYTLAEKLIWQWWLWYQRNMSVLSAIKPNLIMTWLRSPYSKINRIWQLHFLQWHFSRIVHCNAALILAGKRTEIRNILTPFRLLVCWNVLTQHGMKQKIHISVNCHQVLCVTSLISDQRHWCSWQRDIVLQSKRLFDFR